MILLNLQNKAGGWQERQTKRLKKCLYDIFFALQRETAIVYIKQACLISNKSSLDEKSDAVEIDVASNQINNTHGLHEVCITRKESFT